MKKTSLTELKRRHKKAEKTERALRQQIEDAQEKKLLPAAIKKYEGRFFKYMDSYGSDSERWPIYYHCRKVTEVHYGQFDWFESQPGNKQENTFHVNQRNRFAGSFIEITQKEYEKALWKFLDKFSGMQIGKKSFFELITQEMKKEIKSFGIFPAE